MNNKNRREYTERVIRLTNIRKPYQGIVDTACAVVDKQLRLIDCLITQLQNHFHVSVAEIDEQGVHQIIVIGIAAVVPHSALADSLMEEISLFVYENCEAEILDEQREIR